MRALSFSVKGALASPYLYLIDKLLTKVVGFANIVSKCAKLYGHIFQIKIEFWIDVYMKRHILKFIWSKTKVDIKRWILKFMWKQTSVPHGSINTTWWVNIN